MNTRSITIVSAVVLVVLALSACTSSQAAPPQAPTTPGASPTPSPTPSITPISTPEIVIAHWRLHIDFCLALLDEGEEFYYFYFVEKPNKSFFDDSGNGVKIEFPGGYYRGVRIVHTDTTQIIPVYLRPYAYYAFQAHKGSCNITLQEGRWELEVIKEKR